MGSFLSYCNSQMVENEEREANLRLQLQTNSFAFCGNENNLYLLKLRNYALKVKS